VLVARPVHLLLETARRECPLLTLEDVEEVVGRVQARMALRTERRAEEDEVLRDAGVDDVHGAHGAAGVVQDPVVLVMMRDRRRGVVNVKMDAARHSGVGGGEVCEDMREHSVGVVGIERDGLLGDGMKLDRVKDIPPMLRSCQ
jgi:hypothetical protein